MAGTLRRCARTESAKNAAIHRILPGRLAPLLGDHESFYGNKNTRFYVESGHEDYRRMRLSGLVAAARIFATWDIRPTIAAAVCNIPTLVIHGDADPVSPIEQSEWLAQNMPSVALVKLRGAGHVSYGEREQEFETLVPRWLSLSPTISYSSLSK